MSLVVYQALGPLAREEKFTRAKPTSIRPLRPTSRSISVQRGEAVLVAASSRVSSEENRERDRIPHSKRGFCCCPGQEEAARRDGGGRPGVQGADGWARRRHALPRRHLLRQRLPRPFVALRAIRKPNPRPLSPLPPAPVIWDLSAPRSLIRCLIVLDWTTPSQLPMDDARRGGVSAVPWFLLLLPRLVRSMLGLDHLTLLRQFVFWTDAKRLCSRAHPIIFA